MYNKGKSSSRSYIRSENPVFRWAYINILTPENIAKFIMMARIGVPQSEWCSTLWRNTNDSMAPPLTIGGSYEQK